jgi:hypothetical protein
MNAKRDQLLLGTLVFHVLQGAETNSLPRVGEKVRVTMRRCDPNAEPAYAARDMVVGKWNYTHDTLGDDFGGQRVIFEVTCQ